MGKTAKYRNKIGKRQTKKNRDDYEKTLIKMFSRPFTPSKITAKNDYYTYINYKWIADQTEISKKSDRFYVQIDSFRVIQERVYYQLMDLVKNYIKHNKSKRGHMLHNVYNSLLNLNETSAENHMLDRVDMIDGHMKDNDLMKLLATINNNEVVSFGCPIVWSVMPDDKNAQYYRNYISAPQLSVYDYEIYYDDPNAIPSIRKYRREFKTKYFKYVGDILKACVPNEQFVPQDVWDIEVAILNTMNSGNLPEDPDGYNITSISHSKRLGFDWDIFASYCGYKTTPKTFICSSPNYLKSIMDLMLNNDAWRGKKWRTYFIYIYARQIARFHKKWQYIYYEFNNKYVRGQQAIFPREIYPVFGLSVCFNTLLTNEYIKANPRKKEIEYVHNLTKELTAVFTRIIERNSWMSPSTKKYALLKLAHLKLVVGSPVKLREDPLLDYKPNDAWGNLLKISTWRREQLVKLNGKKLVDIPVVDWQEFKLVGTQAYVVNAYYNPQLNGIYIPLGYLQKPFIDLDERGIEYNLAYIGYTYTHEMGHILDDSGSRYDYKGNLFNWWTERDRKIFNEKTKDIIKQYETFAGYDGIKMDGTLSIGENLADCTGAEVICEYLKEFQDKNNDIVPIRHLSFDALFVYLAVQSRQQISQKAIKSQLLINPHPLDKYRTNCPLARIKLFRSVYNIKKGDKMYWPTNETFW